MEKLSKETQKNAQPVTEEKPETSSEQPEEPFQLIAPFKISGKTKSMAKAAGLDLSQIETLATRINEWASVVEKRFEYLSHYLEDQGQKLQPLINLSQQVKQRQEQGQGTTAGPQGIDIGALLPLIQQFAGGGGSNPLSEQITQQIVNAGLDSMFAGQKFLKAVQDKMLSNMGAKIVEDSLPK